MLKFRDFHLLQEKSTEETSEFRETMILNHANQCIYMLQLVRNVLSALSPAGWSLILSNTATQPSRTKSVPFDVEGKFSVLFLVRSFCITKDQIRKQRGGHHPSRDFTDMLPCTSWRPSCAREPSSPTKPDKKRSLVPSTATTVQYRSRKIAFLGYRFLPP